ncbi:MAG: protein-(glutamine-N5) methyltransferase, release factor-specific [Henriciella sp.]|uniref:peptide chain release factor N(5)-glutamine methyltransferase n=1 Tax=Henriciella sp. TaxID=1968823 RepID=UPI000C116224|nr:peptide chain release factor N(5)-glutamine methyltransferase [Henriciella sp.]MAN74918.1 protein-(glutamine-N5) methyltransferase, release factor-specific [Henriciella sp.]MBF33887.1 protein-(glutamine-N5) methyltransferase, release factor-specific [Hyphomonadaceae bacterium]MBK76886.1 protein-(glutamine-N5) methyltransferase, release factor-specific [Henriciella sp.]PHR79767.1 MAG: protein-(glutamine-N5) methyltransferase, release factor-specific [Henriciella sp.]|tara:strand:+ start:39 stop:893 length:855 start_codon:yes stop_codon:yes gene_type:complete
MHEARTFQTQLTIAAARLKSVGLERPGREARHLMQHVCGLTATQLINCENDLMSDGQSEAFFDAVERRACGEPYEYLTGEAWFCGLAFACTPDTLIPRGDSEVVVDEALARLPLGREAKVADLGTGTGCLLIALMKQQPGLSGVGIDRSAGAVEVARRNVRTHGLEARAAMLALGWAEWEGWDEMDLIISNPPYIRSDVIGTLDTSVKAYEPHSALDGGTSGLDAYREIISLAARHMKKDAWLVFEIGFDQADEVRKLLEMAGFEAISVAQDTGQRDRVVTARR